MKWSSLQKENELISSEIGSAPLIFSKLKLDHFNALMKIVHSYETVQLIKYGELTYSKLFLNDLLHD